jgi:hypothetical protein
MEGSVCFWASRIHILHYLYGSGSTTLLGGISKKEMVLFNLAPVLVFFLNVTRMNTNNIKVVAQRLVIGINLRN